jgi:methanogenic corrinoid protein MtbC1
MIGGVLKIQEYVNENGVDALGKDALDAVKKAQLRMDGGKLE